MKVFRGSIFKRYLICRNYKSAVFTVLFLFSSLPLFSQSVYVTPAYNFTLSSQSEYRESRGFFGIYTVSAGLNGRLMFFAGLPVLYSDEDGKTAAGVYDPEFGLRFAFFESGDLFLASEVSMLLPFGPSMYDEEDPLFKGVNQFSAGVIAEYRLSKLHLRTSAFHHFLEDEDEKLYTSIFINPVKKNTYLGVFGLNPFYDGSFLSPSRLKNDWYDISFGLSSEHWYPFVPSSELLYASSYIESKNERIKVEGLGLSPLKVKTSLKYFISRPVYAGVYAALHVNDASLYSFGIAFSVEF